MSRTEPTFFLRANHLFLTYPQCPVPKDDLLWKLKSLPNYAGCVVASEQHQDGTPHLHAYVRLSRRSVFRSAQFADVTWGGVTYHGNYQRARSARCVAEYVAKDGDFIADGVDMSTLVGNKKKSKSSSLAIASRVLAGATLKELVEDPEMCGFVMTNLSRIQLYQKTWEAMKTVSVEKVPLDRLIFSVAMSRDRILTAEWITTNLVSPPPTGREFRSKQLFVWGPTEVGKTSMCRELEKYFKVYWAAYSGDFFDGYSDEYDLVVFDEFRGQKTITWLNVFLQGSPMVINIKYGSVNKQKNIACIFLSNLPPHMVFKNVEDSLLEAFIARLLIVNFTSFEIMFQ
nr:rep protein [Cressdnaviricota sp.]